MTLVVGRIVGPRVAIVADTMLTEHDTALPYALAILK